MDWLSLPELGINKPRSKRAMRGIAVIATRSHDTDAPSIMGRAYGLLRRTP
jgi:hypothetical protein